MRWKSVSAALLLLVPATSWAAPVSVRVVGPDGQPLADAIVSVSLPGVAAPTPHGSYTVAQHNISFDPHVLIVPVGATVAFPNLDKVRHHVYSFSKAKRFDLKLYGREEARTVVFDKPGLVTLGCNIHDQMSGFVFVSDTPFAARTDAQGWVSLDVPPGHGTVTVWSPAIRSASASLAQPIAIASTGARLTLTIRR